MSKNWSLKKITLKSDPNKEIPYIDLVTKNDVVSLLSTNLGEQFNWSLSSGITVSPALSVDELSEAVLLVQNEKIDTYLFITFISNSNTLFNAIDFSNKFYASTLSENSMNYLVDFKTNQLYRLCKDGSIRKLVEKTPILDFHHRRYAYLKRLYNVSSIINRFHYDKGVLSNEEIKDIQLILDTLEKLKTNNKTNTILKKLELFSLTN